MKECKIELRSRQYCAAIAMAATAVVGAGVTAYQASQQQKAAKKAANAVANGGEDMYGRKVEPVPYESHLGTDESYGSDVVANTRQDVTESLPDIFRISQQVNAVNEAQRKKRTGGAFQDTIMQEGANLKAMEKGFVPGDVQAQIKRLVSENLGGAFDPKAMGGGSAVAADAARHLGLTSLDIMNKGMALAPGWRSNVDSFIYKPSNVMQDFVSPIAAIKGDAERLQMAKDEAEYQSANNIERADAMPDPSTVGSFRDSLITDAMKSKADANMQNALVGLVNSGVGAYGAYKSSFPTTGNPDAGVPGVSASAVARSTGKTAYNPNAY
jgi:hypothetical protein